MADVRPPISGMPRGYQPPPADPKRRGLLDAVRNVTPQGLLGPHGMDAASRAAGLLGSFGPQADVQDMYDYSRSATDAARSGDYTRALRDALMTGGAMAMAVAPGSVGAIDDAISRASRSARMYNAPNVQGPSIDEYYPKGYKVGADGRLVSTPEQHPLTARYVVGRQVPQGVDAPIPREELNNLTEALVGSPPQAVPRGTMRGDAGQTAFHRASGRPLGVMVDKELSPQDAENVLRHEIGHVIDSAAAGINTGGLKKQFGEIYNMLNNPNPMGKGKPFTPAASGYRAADADREMVAEALRLYMTNPAFIKAKFPDVAKQIRKAVNDTPHLARIVQFNSMAAAAGLAGGAMVVGADQGSQDEGM